MLYKFFNKKYKTGGLLIGIYLLLFLFVFSIYGITQTDASKREFRGVWIASVKNIDWPSRADLTSRQQQEELIAILDQQQALGMNAIVLQIRPNSDALYDSRIEPWSEWLTGQQGRAPNPYYDPLQFAIEACHERGMELHAWFNPFRAGLDVDREKIPSVDHISIKRPDWVVQYGNNSYIDPGVPRARGYVADVIMDVVVRYEVDAVHFDDYFYPYPIQGVDFPDTASFQSFGFGWPNRDAWRRHNVNAFIQHLSNRIHQAKPWVKLGVSPFAVWRNKDQDPEGSDTRAGATTYDNLYADVRRWLNAGWIDYVAPQLYFSIGYEPADYRKLVEWWVENTAGRHLYLGKAAYKINNNADTRWTDPDQIPSQLRLDRQFPEIKGSIFFSAKSFKPNPLGIQDSLTQHYYRSAALVPRMSWMGGQAPVAPSQLEASPQRKGVVLTWKPASNAAFHVIYRFGKKEVVDINNPVHIVAVTDQKGFFIDKRIRKKGAYTYIVTTLDKFQSESRGSEGVIVKVKSKHLP